MIPWELDATELHCTRREDHRLGAQQRECRIGYADYYCREHQHHEQAGAQLEEEASRIIVVAPDSSQDLPYYHYHSNDGFGFKVVVTSGRRTPSTRPDSKVEEGCYEPTSRPRLRARYY